MPRVTFIDQTGKVTTVEAEHGASILQIALDHQVPMETACGGNGFCTTCLCSVQEGMDHLSPRSDREESMGIVDDPQRLGCQARVEGDVTVKLEM